jgi:hypothetical protein
MRLAELIELLDRHISALGEARTVAANIGEVGRVLELDAEIVSSETTRDQLLHLPSVL